MDLKHFKERSDWIKVWSGKWSFHSCSQFGQEWTVDDKVSGKPAYNFVVYIHRKGITDCWVSGVDKDDLCNRLMAEVKKDEGRIKEIANSLKSNADIVISFVKENFDKEIGLDIYNQFWKKISDYYLPHLCVKYIVDYLPPEELKKHLPILEEARVYAEPVFRDQENFMEKIAEQVAKAVGLTKDLVLCTSKEELRKYFNGSKLPEKSALSGRLIESTQFFELGESEIFSGKNTEEAEQIVLPKADQNGIKGQVAYKGKASGIARIVIDPFKYDGPFNEGDILVTGMTRPEFLSLMKKSSAFITDAGGILSHAAIVARELKKPCLIGTQIATKILKDGDLVEVDADKGVVRIIK